MVEKKEKGVLYELKVNGEWGWYKSGDEKKDGKYEGEVVNGFPNGQGTLTFSSGNKYVGEHKDGKPWNGTYYDKDGNIIVKFVNGK